MDPFTQSALGAAFSQSFATPKKMAQACFAGIAGGLAPDLDIVIRSEIDPLLYIEFHRHFTHSIWFIPIGGLLVAAAIWILFRRSWDFKSIYTFATLGYATHAVLDACTSYGTRLFWPLSNARMSWDTISIIDPLVTIPLIIFVTFSVVKKSAKISRIGLGVCVFYLALGFVQNVRVTSVVEEIAASRGHTNITRVKLNPTIGNLIAWRTIYQHNDRYYVNAVIASPFRETQIVEGTSVAVVNAEDLYPTISAESTLRDDIHRFNYFAQGYIYKMGDNRIGDLRYSAEPHTIQPIWGLIIDPEKEDEHVTYASFRGPDGRALGTTWDMVTGNYKPEVDDNSPAP